MKKKAANSKATEPHLGSVDAFGLDQFGTPLGINPLWGAVAGSGLGTLAAIGVRQASSNAKLHKYSEAIGFAVGGGVSAAMLFSDSTRAAGWTGLASAFLNNGLRQLEQLMLTPAAAPTTPTQPTTVQGPVIEPTQVLQGAGVGIVDIEPTTALLGAQRYAENNHDEMPALVGSSLQAANAHIQGMGGPALSGIASHWGATHFSGRH